MKHWLVLTALLAWTCSAALAQQQPATAVNNQDEQINIDLAAGRAKNALSILRSGDKAEINNYVSEVVELEHGVAFEILPHVLRAVNLEKGSTRVMRYAPAEGGKTRYFIQVVTTAEQMPTVVGTIKALDLPNVTSSTGDARYAIRMRHRRASEVANILQNTYLSAEGKVFADDSTNTLFVLDSVSDSRGDLAYVEFYDVPPPQVEFDVQVIEVRQDNLDKLGLDWEAWKRSLGGQLTFSANWFEGHDAFRRLDGLLTLDARTLAEFLNYAARRGHASIKRQVKVAANNLQPGVIRTARRVPYVTYVERSFPDTRGSFVLTEANPGVDADGDPGSPDFDRVVAIRPPSQWQKTDLGSDEEGLLITITPVIGTDMVTAAISVSANTVTGLDELDRPIVTEQDFETVVTLQDLQPLRVATIENEIALSARRGIPVLRDLPVLKYLFSVESKRTETSHIHVIVTPCFCNWRVYEARMLGSEGSVLKVSDSELPELVRKEMLPLNR